MTEQPIVVGVDGSSSAERAVIWAADEAARCSRPLRIVHAVESWPSKAPLFAPPQRAETLTAAGRAVLAEAEKTVRARHPDLEVVGVLAAEEPGALLREESARGFETVVGHRGHGGFASLLLGSTGRYLAERAAGPLVIVRGDPDPGRGEIFLGVDLADDREMTLRYAFETAELRGVRLWVVHVWQALAGYADYGYAVDEAEVRDRLGERMDVLLDPWRKSFPQTEVMASVEIGHPVAALANASDAADLLIVAPRNRLISGIPRLGSVTHGLLHHVHCPLALIRPADPETRWRMPCR
ncbi:universal stress protein [Actinomadura rupiterrae]|uniref:universal stress protein n=1 Tax=Actinomadura rupiterrae TaxID=559627 RepID=UPI0020A32C44|nr:universal stress protein [Actinomadura rupiterrae]MCP2341679.1 nucleotide-binding universal stress UspA family protein [Actinomadura rupiterrae]